MLHPIFQKHKAHAVRQPTSFDLYWTKRRMWIAATASVIALAASTGYYFFVHLPVGEKARLELMREELRMKERIEEAKLDLEKDRQMRREKLEQDARVKNAEDRKLNQVLLDNCLATAEKNYVIAWDRECHLRGLEADCRLPNSDAEAPNKYFYSLKDECFKRYPQDANSLDGA